MLGRGHKRWSSFAAAQSLLSSENDSYIVKCPFPDRDIPVGVTIPEYIQANMGPWLDNIAYVRY